MILCRSIYSPHEPQLLTEWMIILINELCFRTVTETDLQRADVMLKMGLKMFVDDYGGTPNMHLALHLVDDIRRYGPAPVYVYTTLINTVAIFTHTRRNQHNLLRTQILQ